MDFCVSFNRVGRVEQLSSEKCRWCVDDSRSGMRQIYRELKSL